MKTKRYTQGISIFIAPQTYAALKQISDEKEVSLSETVRVILESHIGALNNESEKEGR